MKRWLVISFVIALLVTVLLAGCGTPTSTPTPGEAVRELRVMTYGSFDISDEVVAQFEEAHNAQVQFLDAGDTGQMVSQAILTKDNPEADVMYGIDNTFLSRALEVDLFVPYESENLSAIPDDLELDDEHRVSPVDYGDVCLNYDKSYFEENEVAVPQALEDLTDPAYKGLLVAENPASSSPGLAFLLTTISTLGEDVYLDYWQQLRENDVLIVENWDNAYYNEFSGGVNSGGTRPIVVSYATSPAAEVYFSDETLDAAPTGAVVAPGTCFRQIEFVGILRHSENQALAEAFVDYVLSDTWQNDIPLHMFVFPASETAELPEVFETYAIRAESPATMSVERIEQNRQAWIDAWTDVVLR
jgi:thiamine transport system substrate-binding protein